MKEISSYLSVLSRAYHPKSQHGDEFYSHLEICLDRAKRSIQHVLNSILPVAQLADLHCQTCPDFHHFPYLSISWLWAPPGSIFSWFDPDFSDSFSLQKYRLGLLRNCHFYEVSTHLSKGEISDFRKIRQFLLTVTIMITVMGRNYAFLNFTLPGQIFV